tara:strand:+ start:371 stop:622 length:252 start_codon:yes stop_codon:yes gene_type:complete
VNIGHWLKALSTIDQIILVMLFGFSIYLSKITIEAIIEYYDTKKNHSEFRVKYRVTPAGLLILGFIYCFILYHFLNAIFDFLP